MCLDLYQVSGSPFHLNETPDPFPTGSDALPDVHRRHVNKPIASLSLDLDDLWAYQRSHGDPAWTQHGSYLPSLMPPLLDLLDQHACRITFFVVGADAAAPKSAPWIRMITERGHEVGNHSYNHECWMHRYSREWINSELERAEEAIAAATDAKPRGYRGPAFSWSPVLLDVLAERGYVYDASTLPTYLGPLARAYFLATARLSREQREQHRDLFGSFRDGARPVYPYRWQFASGRSLLEIPVTTIPFVKTPFHMSYLIYRSRFSLGLMRAYLRAAILLCLRTGVNPALDSPIGHSCPRGRAGSRIFPRHGSADRAQAAGGPGRSSPHWRHTSRWSP